MKVELITEIIRLDGSFFTVESNGFSYNFSPPKVLLEPANSAPSSAAPKPTVSGWPEWQLKPMVSATAPVLPKSWLILIVSALAS
jgi:hypothetical protein